MFYLRSRFTKNAFVTGIYINTITPSQSKIIFEDGPKILFNTKKEAEKMIEEIYSVDKFLFLDVIEEGKEKEIDDLISIVHNKIWTMDEECGDMNYRSLYELVKHQILKNS